MTPADLRDWRKHLHLTQTAAAETLGCSRRSIINWEQGKPIPRYIALACRAIANQMRPWGE